MKLILKSLLFLIFYTGGFAQWLQSSGPGTATTNSVAKNGQYLFAGISAGGMLRSSNEGLNWRNMGPFSAGVPVTIQSILVSDTLVVVSSTTPNSLWRSSNNGETWTEIMSGLSNGTSGIIYSMTELGNKLFVATSGNGVYSSTNKGNVWVACSTGLNTSLSKYINKITVSGTSLFAATRDGVFRSSNNGDSWVAVRSGETKYISASDGELFIGTSSGALRSTDNGVTWTEISGGIPAFSDITAVKKFGSSIYAGVSGLGIFRSVNNGLSFLRLNSGLTSFSNQFNAPLDFFSINQSYIAAALSGDGLYAVMETDTIWQHIGLPAVTVPTLARSSAGLLAGTDGRGIYLSKDEGRYWRQLQTGIPVTFKVNALTVNNSEVYAGTGTGIYKSSDGGQTWTYSGLQVNVSTLASSGNSVYAGTTTFLRSTNEGASWVTQNTGLSGFTKVNRIIPLNNQLFLATDRGIFRSSDDGLNWTASSGTNLTFTNINDIISYGGVLYAGGPSVYRSTDGGASWVTTATGLVNFTAINDFELAGNTLFAATASAGVYSFIPDSLRWKPVNTNLTELNVKCLHSSAGMLYAGTNKASVFYRPLSEIVSVKERNTLIPEIGALGDNYPNPFNPITTIPFSVAADGTVSLKIYNSLGQEIYSLVDGFLKAGNYNYEFNANELQLTSGIYYYILSGVKMYFVKKMVFLK